MLSTLSELLGRERELDQRGRGERFSAASSA
jgi:hypothetical protein